MPARMLYRESERGFLRWFELGAEGPPIAWLAGLGMTAATTFLDSATDAALGGARSLLIDHAGFGESDPPGDGRPVIGLHAEAAAAAIEAAGCGPALVVGHSYGGAVAAELARRRPDLAAGLVLAEATLSVDDRGFSAEFSAMTEDAFVADGLPARLAALRAAAREGDVRAGRLYGDWRRADPRTLHRAARALMTPAPEVEAAFLAAALPRTFVYGGLNDPRAGAAVTADAPDPARLEAAGVRIAVVPEAGHMMMIQRPAAFARVVGEALARTARGPLSAPGGAASRRGD